MIFRYKSGNAALFSVFGSGADGATGMPGGTFRVAKFHIELLVCRILESNKVLVPSDFLSCIFYVIIPCLFFNLFHFSSLIELSSLYHLSHVLDLSYRKLICFIFRYLSVSTDLSTYNITTCTLRYSNMSYRKLLSSFGGWFSHLQTSI